MVNLYSSVARQNFTRSNLLLSNKTDLQMYALIK